MADREEAKRRGSRAENDVFTLILSEISIQTFRIFDCIKTTDTSVKLKLDPIVYIYY